MKRICQHCPCWNEPAETTRTPHHTCVRHCGRDVWKDDDVSFTSVEREREGGRESVYSLNLCDINLLWIWSGCLQVVFRSIKEQVGLWICRSHTAAASSSDSTRYTSAFVVLPRSHCEQELKLLITFHHNLMIALLWLVHENKGFF